MNDTYLMVFIAIAAFAILLQAFVMVGMFIATKKTAAQVEALTAEIRTKALPAVESVNALVVNNKERVEEILENLAAATTTARSQLVRIDATLNDVLDRTRLQVIRADELATNTMD